MRLLITLFLLCSIASAQNRDKKLAKKIQELTSGFHGEVGVFIRDLKRNRIAAINEDSLLSTASIVKIPIMIGIMSKIKDKELDYHQVMVYTDSLYYSEGEDILASFKP